jgi:adhesin/invasin
MIIAINGGNNQTATVGTAVAIAPSVIVKDDHNNPIGGVTVTFAVASGGGSATSLIAITDASGIATVGSWTLGSAPGVNTLTATSIGLLGSPATFVATGNAGPATTIAINAGNNQTATVGTAVAIAPSVIVKDASNNPIGGVTVTFAVASGGGSASVLSAMTNVSGIATVGSWTLGSAPGANTLTATAAGLTGSPLTFTATGTAGAATQIAINAGNNQTGTVGTAVAIAPSVIVKDASNNPIGGVTVTFAVASGGGSVTPLSATTDASGIATAGSWTLGSAPGVNTLTATSVGLLGSPVTFTATGNAGPATTIAINAGNNQTATVGTAVAIAPSVIVKDASNNPIGGVTVTFAVASGGGSVTPFSAMTNVSGIATVGSWTLGAVSGVNTLTATAAGLTGSPVTFTATGTPVNVVAPPTQLGITTQPGGAETGMALTVQPVVVILDATGALVPSATNAVTVSMVSSTAAGAAALSGTTTVNAVNGVATFTDLTISKAGTHRLRFTSVGLKSVTSESFKVTRGERQLVITTQPDGATSYEQLDTNPVVEILDETGKKDYRATDAVTVAIATGNGTLSGTLTVNAVHGKAKFTDLVVTGSGSHTLVFSAAPATGPLSATSASFDVAAAPPIVWAGFFGSVDAAPKLNKVKAGNDLRIVFGLGGDEGLAIFAAGSPASQQLSCTTLATTGELQPVATDDISLSYNKLTQHYVLRWQTSTSLDGGCRALVLTLADGSTHTAYFSFSK